MHIKKKTIFAMLALVLILSASVTALLASDESTNSRIQRMENSLFPKLRSTVADGLISQDLAVRIVDYWKQKPENELSQLYQRVINMLESKKEAQIQDTRFVELLRTAVNQELLTREKTIEIKTSWEQKTPSERVAIYQRLKNLIGNDSR